MRNPGIQSRSELVVAGGGPAGIAAALAAARSGVRTTLLEVHGCLGGVWTAGLLSWIFEGSNPGIASEIAARLAALGARNPWSDNTYSYDIETMKWLLESMCVEAGVRIRLHTRVVDAVVDPSGRLTSVVTESKSGREAWPADCFVDATGDGDLGALAGVPFEVGNEAGETQPGTLMALLAVPDVEKVRDFVSFLDGRDFDRGQPIWPRHEAAIVRFQDLMARQGVSLSYGRPTVFHVRDHLLALMVNHEYRMSAFDADDLTRATLHARDEIQHVVRALKRAGGPWEGVTLAATGEQIGVREGRRLRGIAKVTVEDLVRGARFPDGVCQVNYGVDIHSTNPDKGKGLSHGGIRTKPYQIPWGALVADGVDGLLMAGRCLSGDFFAHASYRCTGTAVATGEAAGKGAARCIRKNALPRNLALDEIPRASSMHQEGSSR